MSIKPITGRYVTIDLGGTRQRIYFEEAGQGGRSSACTPPGPIRGNGGI